MKAVVVAVSLCVAVCAGCVRAPDWPAAEEIEWKRYENRNVGYALDIPATCAVDEYDQDALVRYHGGPIIAINWVGEREGKERGLWPGHDRIAAATLGGRDGALYMYAHYDGPMGMPVISYVTPHGGKFLGLEFRVAGSELGPVQRHIYESFRFLDE